MVVKCFSIGFMGRSFHPSLIHQYSSFPMLSTTFFRDGSVVDPNTKLLLRVK